LHMKREWERNVNSPLDGLSPEERMVRLYGPGGLLHNFVEQFIRPFLKGETVVADPVAGGRAPLAPNFVQLVNKGQQFESVLKEGPYDVIVTIAQPPSIQGVAAFAHAQAVLSIYCADKPYRLMNPSGENSAQIPWSYQKCEGVNLTVTISS